MMRPRSLLLIVPALDDFPETTRDINFGAAYLAAHIRSLGGTADVLDLNFYPKFERLSLVNTIAENYDVIGFSTYTCTQHLADEYANSIKSKFPRITTILGGPHATGIYYSKIHDINILLKNYDNIFVGDSELTLYEYLSYHRNNGAIIVADSSTEYLSFYDIKPFRTPLYNKALERVRIITSRGCSYKCSFCTNSIPIHRPRYRPANEVAGEMIDVYKEFSSKIFLVDDNFSGDMDRLHKICELVIKEKLGIQWGCLMRANTIRDETIELMQRAGCDLISIGCETGSDSIRANLNKHISSADIANAVNTVKKFKIRCRTSWIFGLPGETTTTIGETNRLIKSIKPDDVAIYFAVPFPGTDLETRFYDNICCFDFSMYYGGSGVVLMRTDALSKKQLHKEFAALCASLDNADINLHTKFKPLEPHDS